MLKLFLSLMIGLCSINATTAQSEVIYHVNSKTLNLRSSPSTSSEVFKKLEKYDNVVLLENKEEKSWVKVRYKELEGYVSTRFIAKGEAVVTVQSVRIGAVCKDGTSSRATGRGACSHHGGVSRWKYENKKNVSIINN